MPRRAQADASCLPNRRTSAANSETRGRACGFGKPGTVHSSDSARSTKCSERKRSTTPVSQSHGMATGAPP